MLFGTFTYLIRIDCNYTSHEFTTNVEHHEAQIRIQRPVLDGQTRTLIPTFLVIFSLFPNVGSSLSTLYNYALRQSSLPQGGRRLDKA
jgi:hypothetical protein